MSPAFYENAKVGAARYTSRVATLKLVNFRGLTRIQGRRNLRRQTKRLLLRETRTDAILCHSRYQYVMASALSSATPRHDHAIYSSSTILRTIIFTLLTPMSFSFPLALPTSDLNPPQANYVRTSLQRPAAPTTPTYAMTVRAHSLLLIMASPSDRAPRMQDACSGYADVRIGP